MLNRHEIAGADGSAFQVEIEAAARELDRLLAPHLEYEDSSREASSGIESDQESPHQL